VYLGAPGGFSVVPEYNPYTNQMGLESFTGSFGAAMHGGTITVTFKNLSPTDSVFVQMAKVEGPSFVSVPYGVGAAPYVPPPPPPPVPPTPCTGGPFVCVCVCVAHLMLPWGWLYGCGWRSWDRENSENVGKSPYVSEVGSYYDRSHDLHPHPYTRTKSDVFACRIYPPSVWWVV
jgi:hypothetical protein